jgi:hypothetical protein
VVSRTNNGQKKIVGVARELISATRTGDTQNKKICRWFFLLDPYYIGHVASLAMAEAMAMHAGISFANGLGLQTIIAESDSMETIEACIGEEAWLNESAAIFADCVDLLAQIGAITFKNFLRKQIKWLIRLLVLAIVINHLELA